MKDLKDCKHDSEFVLLSCHAADRPPYAWFCTCGCGFYLNFDPDLAGTVRGFRWRKFGVAFTATPVDGKTIIIPERCGKG